MNTIYKKLNKTWVKKSKVHIIALLWRTEIMYESLLKVQH